MKRPDELRLHVRLWDRPVTTQEEAVLRKAAASKAARTNKLSDEFVDAPRGPPPIRLLDKAEILALTGMSFPTIWSWMRAGRFPRSRVIGRGANSKSVWRSDEVGRWLDALLLRELKGDKEITI